MCPIKQDSDRIRKGNSNTIINCSYFPMKHYTHCSEKTLPDFMQPIYTRGLSELEASTPPRESTEEIISHKDTAKNLLQQLNILNPIGFNQCHQL